MGWGKKILWGILVLDLVAVNGMAGYLLYKSQVSTTPFNSPPKLGGDREVVYQDRCGEDCRKYIDERITNNELRITITPGPTQIVTVGKSAPTKAKVRTVQYVSIPGSGSTTANSWTDVTGTDFYFNKADYPGLVEVYLEVNMSLFNGNGMAYAQLFDVTHGVGVQGSDVSTASQTNTLVTSGKVTFWAGKNLIRVQAKSLTADTAVYTSGRLRIVTEN